MMRTLAIVLTAALLPATAARAGGVQLGAIGKIEGAVKKANDVREIQFTDAEEGQLGAAVSEKIRARYGVVQDEAVHRYVALLGGALAGAGTRPALTWTFVVLDTDGVNAFAAPGGFIHITRGALALISDESELAGVLAHEIIHVTERHTIRAMQKSRAVQMGAAETLSGNSALLERAVNATYDNVVEKGFGREEENDSDEKGLALANSVGYAPAGLSGFLTRLKERNKDTQERRGLFASHPEMQSRLDNLQQEIATRKMASSATLADRYKQFISYTPKAVTEITTLAPGAAGLAEGEAKTPAKKADQPKKKGGFGLSKMLPAGGGEKQQAQVTGSGSARGWTPRRMRLAAPIRSRCP
jgi:predicted Zn-dependent protease